MRRQHWNRPRADMKEWDEASSASPLLPRLAFALWRMLWHIDAEDQWGRMLAETRKIGYDGELMTHG